MDVGDDYGFLTRLDAGGMSFLMGEPPQSWKQPNGRVEAVAESRAANDSQSRRDFLAVPPNKSCKLKV